MKQKYLIQVKESCPVGRSSHLHWFIVESDKIPQLDTKIEHSCGADVYGQDRYEYGECGDQCSYDFTRTITAVEPYSDSRAKELSVEQLDSISRPVVTHAIITGKIKLEEEVFSLEEILNDNVPHFLGQIYKNRHREIF